jgi:vancomycin resistance protein YoaR
LTASTPEITTAQARALGVVEKMATFTQSFPYAPYRFQNIGQAAERVNGTLLLPGDVFSMNDTVLERTPENGYTTGFVIKDGRLTEDLGGGVSTITTAVWNTAFFAGLERIEQRAHSFYISRYQAGLEATVSWGNLDLKFRNDSGNGVFITSERGRNFVTVTMWGTKKYDIDDESSPRTNVKPFGTVYDGRDTCTPQQGVQGFTIVVTRVFTLDGVEVKREPLRTTYRPAANVICRPAPKPPTTPAPTSSPKTTSSPKPTSR